MITPDVMTEVCERIEDVQQYLSDLLGVGVRLSVCGWTADRGRFNEIAAAVGQPPIIEQGYEAIRLEGSGPVSLGSIVIPTA